MSGSPNTSSDVSESRLQQLRAEFDAVRADCLADGHIDPKEAALLKHLAGRLSDLQRQVQASKGAGAASSQAIQAGSSITGSVGQGGSNKREDVLAVQQLLNDNGASPPLAVDGLIGPATLGAIAKFQQNNLDNPESRVDPDGETWRALTGQGGPSPAAPPETGVTFGGNDPADGGPDATTEPNSTLLVRVFDSREGGPAAGVLLSLEGSTFSISQSVDDRGSAMFSDIPSGDYAVSASVNGEFRSRGFVSQSNLPPGGTFEMEMYVKSNATLLSYIPEEEKKAQSLRDTCFDPKTLEISNIVKQADPENWAMYYAHAESMRVSGEGAYRSYVRPLPDSEPSMIRESFAILRSAITQFTYAIDGFQAADNAYRKNADPDHLSYRDVTDQAARTGSLKARADDEARYANRTISEDPERATRHYQTALINKDLADQQFASYEDPGEDLQHYGEDARWATWQLAIDQLKAIAGHYQNVIALFAAADSTYELEKVASDGAEEEQSGFQSDQVGDPSEDEGEEISDYGDPDDDDTSAGERIVEEVVDTVEDVVDSISDTWDSIFGGDEDDQ